MSFLHFACTPWHNLLTALWQQIYLVAFSMLLAMIVGMSFGILATRFKHLKNSTIAVANILQTIPSIALLGLLLPFVGIGATPAIIALTVYALLPIVRNTISGIENIPPASLEAAQALGFTYRQRLFLVEIPLALPIILTGIRTATVMCVGIATIAAFIGAGGLGTFIYQGLSLNSNNYLLLGAIPAALMALILDALIGLLERHFDYRRNKRSGGKGLLIALAVIVIVIVSVGIFHRDQRKPNTVIVATKNFTEQFILGNLMTDLIQAKTHLHVIKKFDLGSTAMCQAALMKGDIDLYPEYTGTAYLTVLKDKYHANISEKQLYQITKTQYEKRFHLTWLPPFGYNNTEAIIVRQGFAKHYHLKTISQLAHLPYALRTIASPAAFAKRADGMIGLRKVYGLTFSSVKLLQPDLMYEAIRNKMVNVIAGFSTDGRIAAYHLLMLKDNKHFYPPYFAAPIIRMAILKKYPQIKTALAPLTNAINNKEMQQMNYDVNVKHESPAAVAKRFLLKHGLI
jgi:osmoprotectant transport system permease protein